MYEAVTGMINRSGTRRTGLSKASDDRAIAMYRTRMTVILSKRPTTSTELLDKRLLNLTRGQVRYSYVISLAIEHVIIIGKPYIVKLNFL
jgi:hypothetical protein